MESKFAKMKTNILLTFSEDEFKQLLIEVIKAAMSDIKIEIVEDKIMTRQEVADYLRISLPTLHEYMKKGRIPFHRINSRIRFKKRDLDKLLSDHSSIKEYVKSQKRW